MAKNKVKYKVIHDFTDLQDGGKVYEENDYYPYPANKKVTDARVKELLGKSNKQGRPVIREEVEETE